MKKPFIPVVYSFCILLAFPIVGCEKEITVGLPSVDARVVVEGTIEQDQPPIVLLSSSQGYFEPTDLSSLENFYLGGATVVCSNGEVTDTLDEICTSTLPPELLDQVADILGFPSELLAEIDICAYTALTNLSLWGEAGKTYSLNISYEEHELSTQTKINDLVSLDSTWFEIAGNSDSLGFLHAMITDPDTIGNAYRWYAQRINTYPEWSENAGEIKDARPIAPIGSVTDDEFFNGLSFEFAYYRGTEANMLREDDLNEEAGFYKVGDTVAVRGCTIDYDAFLFITALETQTANQGSPFAVPGNLPSNVDGGLGAFIGYGVFNDTIICQP